VHSVVIVRLEVHHGFSPLAAGVVVEQEALKQQLEEFVAEPLLAAAMPSPVSPLL
jgi:hypothetical protein